MERIEGSGENLPGLLQTSLCSSDQERFRSVGEVFHPMLWMTREVVYCNSQNGLNPA